MKKQKCGLYRTKMKIGVDGDGKPIYKYLSAPTQRALEEEKRRARALYIDGTGLEQDQLFGVYAVEWYHTRKEPHVSPSSRAGYRSMLNKHILPAFGGRNLRAIRSMDIQRFLNGLEGMSSTMIIVAMATLRGVFRSALQDRIVSTDPTTAIQKPKCAPPKEKRALTPGERQRVESAALSHPDGILLALLYWLGVRSGEARGLKWGDVDWKKQRVHIQRDIDTKSSGQEGELKTKGSKRWIPVHPKLMGLLKDRRGMPEAYIVPGAKPGKPLYGSPAERKWAELRDAADLPEEITQHWLRHNFITMCRDAGIRAEDTMYMAGHVSYQTTLSVYTHMTEEHLAEISREADQIFDH